MTTWNPCNMGSVYNRLTYPSTPIIIAKTDLDAAYCWVHSIWNLSVQCISIIGTLAYLLLHLPFGATAAPAEFCVMSEAICDTANNLLQDPTWDPLVTKTDYDCLMPAPSLFSADIAFAIALPLDVHLSEPVSTAKCDAYIDDIITVGLFLPQLLLRLIMTAPFAIFAIFALYQLRTLAYGIIHFPSRN